MTTPLTELPERIVQKPVVAALETPNFLKLARQACLRISPLWPLQSFVAVNPFVGLVGKPFTDVCNLMQRVTGESMLMSVEYFRQQFASGRLTSQDLAEAVTRSKSDLTTTQLLAWLKNPEPQPHIRLQSIADIATTKFQRDWSGLVTEEISKWCAAYFDEGQSVWRIPWKKLPLFTAWKQAAEIDATPEMLGFNGFRSLAAGLPKNAAEAIPAQLDILGISPLCAEEYLHRLLMTLPGWSSYVQHHVRDKAMRGTHDESLLDLLAVRLVFEVALLKQFESVGIREHWLNGLNGQKPGFSPTTQKQLLWHCALEISFQRELCNKLTRAAQNQTKTNHERPIVQAVFCIDVRSEVMRRSLESASPGIETLGFAGFFGMPIEYVPFGQRHGTLQLPVLFSPKYRVREHLPHATPEEEKHARSQLQLGRRVLHSWNAFKTSAVSCFSFVEAAGIGFAWNLVKDSFQLGSRKDAHFCHSCAAPNLHQHKRLAHDPMDTHTEAGIPPEDQIQLALGALKNMELTSNFARLVMFCGHGSNTTNNPYAAGLDCGACGGHAGDSNARVAAAILNQNAVRTALQRHGIFIPEDTCFIAGLHDTTTDDIRIFDTDCMPSSHETDLHQLQLWLDQATHYNRQQRAASLGLASAEEVDLKKLIIKRSRDWSQVRPEWGLAGNAAFIAAPRERTRSLNLHGRVFLHNYSHTDDSTKSTLELIMTAPMVVTNWINLQYYASTVNNRLWGSGNKVIHNVVGTFGIQQGNGGDLQTGLPLQSVHNGENWMHEPLRLSVFIEAPRGDIDMVIAKHEGVSQLVDNGWLHLFCIEDQGRLILKRQACGSWITA
ncbi:hypothetical protein EI77_01445 [Prosthecobacter fusiformis]|uniref:Probable inorganic carbon transporter subunit DabA n=1 Tax=Prosthecobacter fusiformis TaxID=48464 RepID=A0A4R7S530_9BACT|nr:DUF2309 domain-containing protein [Prosthecobacter fusiformis]TDU72979.1 hypothetical protein EI77_01445 [Prosthecobacter fusiformis]